MIGGRGSVRKGGQPSSHDLQPTFHIIPSRCSQYLTSSASSILPQTHQKTSTRSRRRQARQNPPIIPGNHRVSEESGALEQFFNTCHTVDGGINMDKPPINCCRISSIHRRYEKCEGPDRLGHTELWSAPLRGPGSAGSSPSGLSIREGFRRWLLKKRVR